jgi:probable rRNA maturation factor
METFNVTSTIKNYPTSLPLEAMKSAILGKSYALSVTFVGTKRARKLNQTYRQKTYVPNILSFPLTKTAGEMFICPDVAKREATKYELTLDGYIAYLFIHGCLHLKGHDHGDTMEKLERRFLTAFNIT